ncbi:hypothetical protein QBC47DRAFT_151182 [Echria macrotheca]|uniref:Uncharacterized protein n=1 Tax=Echria macrotheca TaxID=438768 RepID=A0AAJ0B1J0_9PEZI|nr:hypothetical protein QBC47DRAFT_151182 [Echria macrotheca]
MGSGSTRPNTPGRLCLVLLTGTVGCVSVLSPPERSRRIKPKGQLVRVSFDICAYLHHRNGSPGDGDLMRGF